MRLRTFTATDMPSAMAMVRSELGDDAIIISSKDTNGKSITVTAAIDPSDEDDTLFTAKPFERITARDNVPDDLRFALQGILRFHNLPELFIAKIIQNTAEGDFISAVSSHRAKHPDDEYQLHLIALEKLLEAYFSFNRLIIEDNPSRIMLVGTPGIGKTLTAAKLATRIAMAKESLVVISTDTKRAGGVEQLQAFTDILDTPLCVVNSRTELWKKLKSIPAKTHVIIDTAGCNPYDEKEWKELYSYASIENIEPVLVMPSGGDSAEAIDITEIFASLPIKRLLITRADSTRRFGGALAAAAAHGLAFSHTSTSSSVVESLHPLNPTLLAKLLLRYQESNYQPPN